VIFPWHKLILPGIVFATGLAAGLWAQQGRVVSAQKAEADQRATADRLQDANASMHQQIENQSVRVLNLARQGQEAQMAAAAALEAARRDQRVIAKTIGSLTARIEAGGASCAQAVSELRSAL
jgi:predicted  nucleic acid-binding Zn-ribbon protein